MRIVIFNWRDIKSPKSGGAEILTHELAKRWVVNGHFVTQVSSYFKGAKKEELIDGVKIIRKGHPDARYLFWSVHFQAFWFYITVLKGKFDVVIDEIHGLPFFTPWYVKEKKIVLICEVADELWRKLYGSFFGNLGRMTELFYLKYVYKNIYFLTISESTKNELINHGIKKNVTVIPMGFSIPKNIRIYKKEKNPTLLFVGRLSRTKGIEDVLRVMRLILSEYSSIRLWIVGRGESKYEQYLKSMSKKLSVEDKTVFFGYVSERKKYDLMGKAHILLAPSLKEGWGLITVEASLVGTPSIVYDAPGLRDVIKNEINGLISERNASAMAWHVKRLLNNKFLYNRLQKNGVLAAKKYSWDETAKVTMEKLSKL